MKKELNIGMISILIVIFIAGDAYSAVVGHDAEKIRSGTFGSGNYTFPDSVFITNYFGIGTTSPQRKLHINGSILSNATINATGDICIEGGSCLSGMGTGSMSSWTIAGDDDSSAVSDEQTVTIAGSSTTDTAQNARTVTVSVQADSIGDTQLAYNTGQHLTTSSSPTFSALTVATVSTGSGAKELGDASVANGDTDSIPTGDQVYDFVIGQGYLTSETNWNANYSARTGTGNVVFSVSPTLTGTLGAATITMSGLLTANGGITADSGVFTVADTTGAIHTGNNLDVDGVITAGSTPVTLTGATGYVLETAITQNSLDDSEIATGGITSDSVAGLQDADLGGGGDNDFGDFSCTGAENGCTLDNDVVAAAEMANADHGDVAWSGGVATVQNLQCTGCVAETEIAQNTLDDSEIEDNSLSASSLAANSVSDSELMDSGDWTTSGNICIGAAADALCISSDGYLSDEDDLLTFNDDARVIGTTPQLTMGDAGAEDTHILFDGNAEDFYIGLDDSADDFVIGEDSTIGTNVRLTIQDDTGNVGIGTTSPSANLEVGTHSGSDQEFRMNSAGNTYFSITTDNTAGVTTFRPNHTAIAGSHQLQFQTHDNNVGLIDVMRLDQNGNIGIGTTDTSNKHLSVYDDAVDATENYYGIYNYHKKTAGASDDDSLRGIYNYVEFDQAGEEVYGIVGDYNVVTLKNGSVGGYSWGGLDVIRVYGGSNASGDLIGGGSQAGTYTGGNVSGDVVAHWAYTYVQPGADISGDIITYKVSSLVDEDPAGKVYLLYLRESGDYVDYAIYQNGSADSYFNGSVGIGTTEPEGSLHIFGGDSTQTPALNENINHVVIENDKGNYLEFMAGDEWINAIAFSDADDSNVGAIRYNHYNDVLSFHTSGDEWMRITSTGSVGIGDPTPDEKLDVNGDVAVYGGMCIDNADDCTAPADGSLTVDSCTGCDIAEAFDAYDNVEAGDVVVINPVDYKLLKLANKPYDTMVAGIVSSEPTIVMGGNRDYDVPLALSGVVPTKVTTENGQIEVGDLLTTSSTPGHAMKFTLLEFTGEETTKELAEKLNENEKRRNSILGKALESCDKETHKIMALVTLQ